MQEPRPHQLPQKSQQYLCGKEVSWDVALRLTFKQKMCAGQSEERLVLSLSSRKGSNLYLM